MVDNPIVEGMIKEKMKHVNECVINIVPTGIQSD